MSFVSLHNPVASSRRLERVHMFPGRHLGEEEFERQQDYTDARLAPLLRSAAPGIVHGLDITLGPKGTAEAGLVVNPGLAVNGDGQAVGLHYPLRVEWAALAAEYLAGIAGNDATGAYYLVLRRDSRQVDGPTVDACQRTELDPTRDMRWVVAGSVALHRLAIDPQAVTKVPRERVENWVAAGRVDGDFMAGLKGAVPLALVALRTDAGKTSAVWLSQEAGRYEALPASGYRVLLSQASAALRRVMQRAELEVSNANPLPQFLADNLHLDYLPAAGQLPLDWLRDTASPKPSVLWLPKHLGIDMVPVPEEAVLDLINRHLARRVIDLRHPAGDRIRLLLAVNEPDYRHDLLDIPPTDARLEAELFRYYLRAHEAWKQWRRQFDLLYYVEPSNAPALLPNGPNDPLPAVEHRVLDPAQFRSMDLPKPFPPPPLPKSIFKALIDRAAAELQDPQNPGTPYPYSKGVPAEPAFYAAWTAQGNPAAPAPPADDGLVVQYAVALVELEAIENQARALTSRLEKTRDYLMLQRQQLDSQTVALAALAGGVAGDGSGLQVARYLPYATFDASVAAKKIEAPLVLAKASAPAAAPARSIVSGFAGQLMDKAVAATVSEPRSMLGNKPATFSAFELSINKTWIDKLALVPKAPVSTPAFEAKEFRFGVLDHISPEINEYKKAYYAMVDLLAALAKLFDPTDAASLRRSLKATFKEEDLLDPALLEKEIDNETKLAAGGQINPGVRGPIASQKRYAALFTAGKILTQWIAVTETRYNAIERKLQAKLREQSAKRAQIDKLAAFIRVAREGLENLDRSRIEQLGDYGVAQRLLDENWHKVYGRNQERSRILTQRLRGLYYVRVRPAPVAVGLADPLPLRYGGSGDPVPGCDWSEDVDLPAELTAFFAAVCEIPMADWAALKPLTAKLPPFTQFDFLAQVRQARFRARPAIATQPAAGATLQARLQAVQQHTQAVLESWAKLSLPAYTTSSVQTQAEAAKVLSLEDLAGGAAGSLRKDAQALREKLEHGAACLLENLNLLPPSLRLQWGQLAEDDRLRVEDVSRWPGLEQAERDDFNATRTVAELIAWWFRQLDGAASANSVAAMRNLVRSTLIHASLGDPREIVSGIVSVPPRFAAVGEALQVKLSRAPAPGTLLQLQDESHRVVAVLAVEDHGPESTRVKIVDLVQPGTTINSRFAVVASKRNKEL